MLESIVSFLIGLLYVFLYSILFGVVLLPIYYLSEYIFSKFKTHFDSWIYNALATSFVVSFIILVILYFFPFVFLGWEFKSFILLEGAEKFLLVLKIIWNLIYLSLICMVLAQPFAMIFSALHSKFDFENKLLRVYVSLYVISFIVLFLNMLFPWIFGGIITMIYF